MYGIPATREKMESLKFRKASGKKGTQAGYRAQTLSKDLQRIINSIDRRVFKTDVQTVSEETSRGFALKSALL